MPAVVKDSLVAVTHAASGSTVTVSLHGATVTSWMKGGKKEMLYLSPKAIMDGSKAIRGGIPLVFPIFGTVATSKLPQHGFARLSKWNWGGVEAENEDEITAAFTLEPAQVKAPLFETWGSYPFKLVYRVVLRKESLVTSLTVLNTGTQSFDFTTLLHTYFQDITKTSVVGLKGVRYADKVLNTSSNLETPESITFSGEVDRTYENVPVNASNDVVVRIQEPNQPEVQVKSRNFKDVVVWNPWIEKAKGMADFPDEGYLSMVCVEVGTVASSVLLGSGEQWSASQELN